MYGPDAKRCVSLCTVQTEKSRSLVCRSLSPLMILYVSSFALEIAFIKKVLQKLEEPIGAPRTRMPSVTSQGIKFPLVSFVLEYFDTACFMDCPTIWWSSWFEWIRVSILDVWLVSILVFSVFMIAPRGSANSLNLSSRGSTSCNATIALQSSTYARIKPRVPFLSSPLSPSLSRCDPRLFSSSCSSVSILFRTMAAKIGEKGHPCEKPSVTGMMVQVSLDLLTMEYIASFCV